MNMIEELKKIEGMEEFAETIEAILAIDDSLLNEDSITIFQQMFAETLSEPQKEKTMMDILNRYKAVGAKVDEVKNEYSAIKDLFDAIIHKLVEDNTNDYKVRLISLFLNEIIDIVELATESYMEEDCIVHIELVHENAKMPQYAHETDACADIYCPEEVTVPARTRGMIVKTGLKMALVPGWCVKIYPRSSVGVKTPLRLSNSVGIIDSDYRDEVGLILDNTSSKPYTIAAGDRIAQMEVVPVYRAKFNQVDDVSTIGDNRGGGYGSTGA